MQTIKAHRKDLPLSEYWHAWKRYNSALEMFEGD